MAPLRDAQIVELFHHDQVLPFLDPEAAELHNSPASWEQTRLFVTETLLAAT